MSEISSFFYFKKGYIVQIHFIASPSKIYKENSIINKEFLAAKTRIYLGYRCEAVMPPNRRRETYVYCSSIKKHFLNLLQNRNFFNFQFEFHALIFTCRYRNILGSISSVTNLTTLFFLLRFFTDMTRAMTFHGVFW